MFRRFFTVSLFFLWSLYLSELGRAQTFGVQELERLSKQGQTLDAEVATQFPLREQPVRNDTGINVLVDLAHQATFLAMWSLPGELRRNGFRAVGSQATLDTVLTPGRLSRVRIPRRLVPGKSHRHLRQ